MECLSCLAGTTHHLGASGRWAIIVILTALIAGGGCGYYWYYRNYIKPRRYQQAVGEFNGSRCTQRVAAPVTVSTQKGQAVSTGRADC